MNHWKKCSRFLGSSRAVRILAVVNSSLFSRSWSYWKCADSKRKKKERGGRLLQSQARRFPRRLSPSNGEALVRWGGVGLDR